MFWGHRTVAGVIAALTAIGFALGAAAATWRLEPRAEADIEYTDNVRAVSSGAESDLIFTARPGFNLRGSGARLQLNLDAQLNAERYRHADDLGTVAPQFQGNAGAELLENYLFFDVSTSYRRAVIDRNAALASSTRDLGANQTDVFNVRGGPTLRLSLGRWALSETRFAANQTMYNVLEQNDDPNARRTSDATVLTASQRFSSGPKFSRLAWTLGAESSRTTREADDDANVTTTSDGDTFERHNIEGTVEYAVYRWLIPQVRVGVDRLEDNSLGGAGRDGPYYLFGGTLRPGPRTELLFLTGRRFDEPTYEGAFSYRLSSALELRADYRETVTTEQEFESSPFDFVGTDESGLLIDTRTGLPLAPGDPTFDQSFRDVVFRSRNFVMGLTGTRLHNTYSLNLFVNRRDTDGSPAPRETTTTGFAGSVTRTLAPDLRFTVNASYRDTSDTQQEDSQLLQIGTALNYDLSDTLTTGLRIRHLRRDTDGIVDNDLTENSVVVTLRKTF